MRLFARVQPAIGTNGKLPGYGAILVALIAICSPLNHAAARERTTGRILTAIGDDRYLLARVTDEGVILRFCGETARNDDPVVLLRDFYYIAGIQWLAGTQTAVVAVGRSESSPELFGFSPGGEALWYHPEEPALDDAGFLAMPGDSTIGFVPVDHRWGVPRPLSLPRDLDFPRRRAEAPQAGYPLNVVGDRPAAIEWTLAGDSLGVVRRDFATPDPVWAKVLPLPGGACRLRDRGGVIGGDTAWFAWQCDFEPFTVVAVDFHSGEPTGQREFAGYEALFFPEPGGRRLLMWLQDPEHRGRFLLLDGPTLSGVDTLAATVDWIPAVYGPRSGWESSGNLTLVSLDSCAMPGKAARQADGPNYRTLAIEWGDTIRTHFLPVAACFDAHGTARVWYEWTSEGPSRRIEILAWTPPQNEPDAQTWEARWSRLRF